ncbi:MAG TPA: host attachment protein [Bdellovibrionota bacterium]|jgi:protein required for attachment to host cells|nr:host attachment protein [Bdellovibrionota bacterium]
MGHISAAHYLDLSTHNRWYVLANRTHAVVYTNGAKSPFQFVQRLSNPEGRMMEIELDADKPGRGVSSAGQGTFRHAFDRRSHSHERSAKRFALQIGQALTQAWLTGLFDHLTLVAEPHFLGLLRGALPPAIRDRITHEVVREYLTGSDAEIWEQILRQINEG